MINTAVICSDSKINSPESSQLKIKSDVMLCLSLPTTEDGTRLFFSCIKDASKVQDFCSEESFLNCSKQKNRD